MPYNCILDDNNIIYYYNQIERVISFLKKEFNILAFFRIFN